MNAAVLFYSYSGNTRTAAQAVADAVDASLYPVMPAQPYPQNYKELVAQVLQEIRQIQAGQYPAVKQQPDLSAFDVIFVGSPNWCGVIAPVLSTVLAATRLEGKTVAPFFTHGGGGTGHMADSVRAVCPGANIMPELALNGAGSPMQIASWLEQLGLQK